MHWYWPLPYTVLPFARKIPGIVEVLYTIYTMYVNKLWQMASVIKRPSIFQKSMLQKI